MFPGPMDPGDLSHLLRRTEFVVRPARFDALVGGTVEAAVDDILDMTPNGVMELPVEFRSEGPNSWEQYVAASNWWLTQMLTRPRPFIEKMVLFWHGHFTSAWWEVDAGYQMMTQLHAYRLGALGGFRELTHTMATTEAMLVYLSNAFNRAASPNQNFARELMELFTLGVGNYTEDDVIAAARAWTGHNYNSTTQRYEYRDQHHDKGLKTFFGTTKNWDGPDIIDEILRDNVGKQAIAARFIATKLWEFLAHPGPPAGVVDALAADFVASGLSIRALARAILLRPEFYAPAAKQGLVRTPVEYAVAVCHHSGLVPGQIGMSWRGEGMGQSLLNPPNVAGWKHNGYWLNTSSFNGRADLARSVTWELRKNGGYDNLYAMTPDQAVDFCAQVFGIHPLSSVTRDALIAAHTAERATVRWNNWWAPTNLLTMTMLTPEFHQA